MSDLEHAPSQSDLDRACVIVDCSFTELPEEKLAHFLEWLHEQGYVVATWADDTESFVRASPKDDVPGDWRDHWHVESQHLNLVDALAEVVCGVEIMRG